MNSITVDTCVWVRLIDGKDEEEIFQLLEHCKKIKYRFIALLEFSVLTLQKWTTSKRAIFES